MIIDISKEFVQIDALEFKKYDLVFNDFNLDKHYKDSKKDMYTLHNHGDQLFCKFKINQMITKSGIYFFVFDNEIKYVGECENLSSRINSGYGNISPRNCYVGGQRTNCKINGLINSSINKRLNVYLYFCETDMGSSERKRLESGLIKKLKTISQGYNSKG